MQQLIDHKWSSQREGLHQGICPGLPGLYITGEHVQADIGNKTWSMNVHPRQFSGKRMESQLGVFR